MSNSVSNMAASPSSAAVAHATEGVKCEPLVDADELDPLSLPLKSAPKPRVRRRRLCELSDSEIWRCMHCGKCYSKTSKAAILEHSRSSCQRKIAEDAEIKRQIEQYFTCTQNPNKFHVGMNINLSMQHYPGPGFNGRMNPAANGAYGAYPYPTSQPQAGMGMPVAMPMPMPMAMPMLMRSHANVIPPYTQTHPRALFMNEELAAQYPAVYDDSNACAAAMYAPYATQLPAETQMQLSAAALKYAAPHAQQALYDQSPAVAPGPGSVSVRSSSGGSLSPNHAAQSAASASDGALSLNQKMSAAQINQMNFITPAHASRSIQPIPSEVAADALPPAAASCSTAQASNSLPTAVGSNSDCSSPHSSDDLPSSSQPPQAKRQRITGPPHFQQQQQHYVHPQAPASYSDYEYTYQRQGFPPRAAGIRHFSSPSVSAAGGAILPSTAQRNMCHFATPACAESMLSLHNYRPESAAHAAAYSTSAAQGNTLNSLSVAATDQSAKHFSVLHPRVGAVGAFSRSNMRPELLHNPSSAHWQ